MAATVTGILLTGTHASRPASGLSAGTLYSCTTHSLVYQTSDTGSTWATWADLTASSSSSFVFPGATSPSQTAEGSAVWDTDDDVLTIGDGSSRKTLENRVTTTRGDIIVRGASINQRLAIGAAGKILQTVDGVDPVWGYSAPILGCKVYNSTTQSFNATTLTTITFDSEEYDTATMHDTGSNTGRLVAPVTGKYCVKAGIWYATTSGTNYVLFDKNGAGSYIRGGATAQNGGGSGMFLATDVMLSANDYITVVGYHTEAGSIATGDTGTTPSQQNWAAMYLIGI